MKYKKGLIFICLIICLFSIASVCASEINNDTNNLHSDNNEISKPNDDFIDINEDIGNHESINQDINVNNSEIDSNNFKHDEEILSSVNEDNLGVSPAYNVIVSAKSRDYGTAGVVNIQLSPRTSGVSYDYYFHVNIYDSKGDIKVQDVKTGNTHDDPPATYYNKKLSSFLSGDRLGPGDYTVKIVDFYSNNILDSCSFTIYPIHYSEYTVDVKDTIIKEGSNGVITMTISPTQGMYSRYDFNLRVYDSKNKVVINKRYAEENVNTGSVSYNVVANSLDKGVYTIMVIDNTDGYIFDTAKLTIGDVNPQPDPQPTGYVISVEDTTISYGESGSISISVSEVSKNYYFYLQVYDSENNLKINKEYSGYTDSSFSYQINANSLPSGEYNIKIVNPDGIVLSSAKLTVCYLASDYNVKVYGTSTYCGSSSTITIELSPASSPSYKYDFTLGIYDSDNNMVATEYYSGQANYVHSIKYSVSSLDLGNYTAKVYNGNKVYGTAKVTIVSLPHNAYSVNVSIKNVNYIGNSLISLLDSQIHMSISSTSRYSYKYDFYLKVYDSDNIEIISERYYGTVASTSLTYQIPALTFNPGQYTIKIIHATNNYLLNSVNFTMHSVDYSGYSVDINNTISTFGLVNLNFTVSSGIHMHDFYFKIYDSDNKEIFNKRFYDTKYAKLYYCLYDLNINPGVYTIKILNTDDNHLMKKVKLTVNSVPYSAYSVNVSDVNVNYLSDGNITMSISPASSYYMYKYDFYLKIYTSTYSEVFSERYYNTSYSAPITYHFNATRFNPGTYIIKIINAEDKHQLNSCYLEIGKIISNIIVSPISSSYNEDKHLLINLKDNQGYAIRNASLSVNLNGIKTLITDANGEAKLSIKDLVPNNYTALISFSGNNLYKQSSVSVNVNIMKQSTQIISSSILCNYNGGVNLVITLKDGNGNVISGVQVCINLNGVKYLTTDNNGQVKLSTNGIAPNIYSAEITFEGNENYNSSNINVTVTVNKDSTSLSSDAVTTTYNINKELVITLKDSRGNPIKCIDISVDLNGVKTFTTDAKGQVKIATGNLIPMTYTAKITFNGNNNYIKTIKNVKVTVTKATPKLTATKKTFKVKVKTKKYTITLKNNQNKAMKNIKVTIKVNKKTYTTKTNAKGKATFKIKKLTKKGKYNAVVTYKGDKYYNKVTKKTKIIVK